MVDLDISQVGCKAKLPYFELSYLTNSNSQENNFNNCGLSFEKDDCAFYATIDRVGKFVRNDDIYSRMSVRHFLNDLYAEMCVPISATICVEYGPEYKSLEGKSNLIKCILGNLSNSCVNVSNIHSMESKYSYVTASVIGYSLKKYRDTPESGKIYLTHPLGRLKEIYLNDLDNSYKLEKIDIDMPFEKICRIPISYMSDVTGFGLEAELYNVSVKYNLSIEILFEENSIFSKSLYSIPAACMISENKYPDDRFIYQDERSKMISKNIEVAGPLIVLCNDDNIDKIPVEIASELICIGVYKKSIGKNNINVSSRM